MALISTVEETFVYAPVAPRANDEQGETVRKPSSASPEEGLRLIQDFLRIQRPVLRERVFEFVAEILIVQEQAR
jgi:hypothetical protein